MADNLLYDEGTGKPIATDEIATIHYQKIKIIDGTPDSTSPILGDSSNGLDVDVTRVQGIVTVSASSLPLPSGAATETTLSGLNSKVSTCNTGAVTVSSSVLPSGAATAANQVTEVSHLSSIATYTNVTSSFADSIASYTGAVSAAVADIPSTIAIIDSAPPALSIFSSGVRIDSDTSPVTTNGDAHPFVFNDKGRLKVSTVPAPLAATTGNITAAGQSITMDVTRCSNIMFFCSGTFSGSNCAFEGSLDGTNWFTVQSVRSNANTVEVSTGAISAPPAYAWETSVNGLYRFRVRATAFTSGTQSWVLYPGIYATEPIPAIQSQAMTISSGTVTANLGTGGTGATSLGKAEDAVAASGDTGVAVFAVRRDAPATNVSGAGDYAELAVSGQGAAWASLTPSVGGGWSVSRLISAATTNATNVKGSAGTLGGWYLFNTNAAVRYLKIYNKATAPTVGSDTPFMTIPIPAGGGANIEFPNGIALGTGIGFAITTGVADADTGAVAANEIVVNLLYK